MPYIKNQSIPKAKPSTQSLDSQRASVEIVDMDARNRGHSNFFSLAHCLFEGENETFLHLLIYLLDCGDRKSKYVGGRRFTNFFGVKSVAYASMYCYEKFEI